MDNTNNIVITTLFGIESVTSDELQAMGYDRSQIKVSDGQLLLQLEDHEQVKLETARLNIGLRTAERVLVQLARFEARDFDTLFDQTRNLPWQDWIDKGAAFHVNGYSRKSALFGIPACQSIIKKAIVSQLAAAYKMESSDRVPEDTAVGLIKIQFGIVADNVTMMVDTSGDGLHKRGYRPLRHEAPIKETLAAAMLYLSRFGKAGSQEALFDPFCGSGTIPIEGALMLSNTAPGLNRSFAGETWGYIGKKSFDLMREEAMEAMIREKPVQIRLFGSDIDGKAVSLAVDNSMRAGVGDWIRFKQQDVRQINEDWLREWTGLPYHLIVCNPPYGERLLDDSQAVELYQAVSGWTLDSQGNARPGMRLSIITPDEHFEDLAGGKADKRRKLYNGMIRCTMYHYFKQSRSN